CKPWQRTPRLTSLAAAVEAQRRRARLLRAARPSLSPTATVIVLLTEAELRFVGGGAVVPVRTLGSFVDGLGGYEQLEFD
ncbi:MAG: hypothetical protein JRN24_04075, partial [Nitrososphaerota archaeon]|nr:hypothetical protein [Nitrososphaerota archaeon]